MKYSYYKHKDNWEQSRLISFIIAQVNSKKKLKLEDITKFEWEREQTTEKDTYISTEEIERLRKEAEEMERMFSMQQ